MTLFRKRLGRGMAFDLSAKGGLAACEAAGPTLCEARDTHLLAGWMRGASVTFVPPERALWSTEPLCGARLRQQARNCWSS